MAIAKIFIFKELIMTAKIESWNKWLKAILFLFTLGLFGIVFRVMRFVENKNSVTLVVAIISIIPPLGQVLAIIDTVTEIANNQVSLLAD